jgi:hypothetical protein
MKMQNLIFVFAVVFIVVGSFAQDAPVIRGGTDNRGAGLIWPNPRFIDFGDGTVVDSFTGLMWQRVPSATVGTWSSAISYCKNLTLAGHTDWRLPNMNELASMINYSYGSWGTSTAAWLNSSETPFSNVQNLVWSSTTYAGDTSQAWGISLVKPVNWYFVKSPEQTKNHKPAWAVRGPVN